MKKITMVAVLIFTMLSASLASAAQTGYFSTQHPLPAGTNAPKLKSGYYPTDITIFNATGNRIYAYVPAGGFTDQINPNGYDHIYNYQGAYYTQIVLRGPDGTTINDGYGNHNQGQIYCPHAVITVYGYNINAISVDNSRC